MATSYGFWTLAGVDMSVLTDGFTELERAHGGSDRRMFDQTLRSFRKTEKREWRATCYFPTEADYQAFRTALGPAGSTVTLDGSALPAAVDVKVAVAESPYDVSGGGLSWTRRATVTVREV